MKMTLSETITYMIDERESKVAYEHQMSAMKEGLKDLLKNRPHFLHYQLTDLDLIKLNVSLKMFFAFISGYFKCFLLNACMNAKSI